MLCFCKLAKGLCTILWPVVWHYDIWDAMCGENLLECFYDLVRSLIREFLNVKPHWVIVNHDDVFSSLQPLSGAGWEGQGHKWISGRWLFLSTCEASGGHHTEVHALDQHLVRPRRPVWMQSRIFSRILLGTSIRSSYRCRSSRIVRWLRFSQYRYCNGDTNACLIDFLLGFAPNPNTVLIIDEGSLRSARWGINFPRWFTIPINCCIPATSEGTGIWATAVVVSMSAWSPELSMMWARNRIEDRQNPHLSLRVNPLLVDDEEQLVRVHHVLTDLPCDWGHHPSDRVSLPSPQVSGT